MRGAGRLATRGRRRSRTRTGHFEMEITNQDILWGTPASGTVPVDLQAGDPARVQPGDVLVASGTPKTVARVATDEQVGAVLGRGIHAVHVDSKVLDPWFVAGAISGADSRHASGHVTAILSGSVRTDIRRMQIPVLPIESQQLHGRACRRLAEFEMLVLQAAERSSDIARQLAGRLVNQVLEPGREQEVLEPGQEQV